MPTGDPPLPLLHMNTDVSIAYGTGTGLAPKHEPGDVYISLHTADPDETLQEIDEHAAIPMTLEKYASYVEHGQFIKDGGWYIDQYNVVAIATPQEIAVAEEYDRLHYIPFNRLSHIE